MLDRLRRLSTGLAAPAHFAITLSLAGAAALSATTPTAAQSTFLTGKSVQFIVGMPPGGGEDAYARLLQHYFARHIGGAPTVVVQNMPGAGSLRSVIAVQHAAEDGTVVGMFSSSLLIEAISSPQHVQVDLRNFSFLGNISEDIRVCYIRSEIGIHSLSEIKSHDRTITFGATARGTSGNIDAAVLRNLFGITIKQVDGYAGSADKRLALEKGEIDGDCGGFTSVPKEWIRDKKINILVRMSPTLLDGLDGALPFGGDMLKNPDDRQVYDFLTAPERLGRMFMVSSKVPADRIAVLRTAFEETMIDPQFLADAQRTGMTVIPMKGPDVDRRIAELYNTPPALIERARQITGD